MKQDENSCNLALALGLANHAWLCAYVSVGANPKTPKTLRVEYLYITSEQYGNHEKTISIIQFNPK
jgi:hypothetical protein